MAKSFLDLRETADVMHVGYGVVRRLHRIGELESMDLGGKLLKFRREQVEAAMRKRARRQA